MHSNHYTKINLVLDHYKIHHYLHQPCIYQCFELLRKVGCPCQEVLPHLVLSPSGLAGQDKGAQHSHSGGHLGSVSQHDRVKLDHTDCMSKISVCIKWFTYGHSQTALSPVFITGSATPEECDTTHWVNLI